MFSSWNKLSWHSDRCHLLLDNDLAQNMTLAFQHVEVLCYNGFSQATDIAVFSSASQTFLITLKDFYNSFTEVMIWNQQEQENVSLTLLTNIVVSGSSYM